MEFQIEYSEEKNRLLKQTRGIDFEDIKEAIKHINVLDDLAHHNPKKHPNQRILVIRIKDYAYGVAYSIDRKRKVAFLKTLYPSRVFTKRYITYEKK